ncbi:trans-sulfuration enzyme family protein [Saccharopolyspora sp. 5N102]|uniref:trans-sulfuration enzyme family protein n=1 Tax=Saccharopolyspora sp. 5N102 TaxID=3375155 RepID=UPI00379C97A7
MTQSARSFDSIAVHAGREDLIRLGVHAPPIDLSSTNPLPDSEAGGASYESMAGGGRPLAEGGAVYARLWNPTVARFESALAQLERTEDAVAFSSGMAAMTASVLAAKAEHGGRHVVAVRPLYGGTDHLLASGLLDVEVTYCEPHQVADAVTGHTCLVVVETPANPTLELTDIGAVVTAAAGCPVLVDNTFATPVLQQPALHGAGLVLHSATKYLGGHGDVVGGVIAADAGWSAALRRVRAVTGALLHPMAGYLLHRGLATLPVRVRRQQETAAELADWLRFRPGVRQVFYPGLDGNGAGLLGRQMNGSGAMISIRLAGGHEHAMRVTDRVRLFTHAVSLGGVDSLIEHPAALTHRPVPEEARPGADILRLSIGLEDVEDLRADLDQALAAASTGGLVQAASSGAPGSAR